MSMPSYTFSTPLLEGVVRHRKSRFTMDVNINGVSFTCHCPVTGRIGNIDLSDRPCLLSKAVSFSRKTLYTVEAISLDLPDVLTKTWIGINQNAVNRYVEHYLMNEGFSGIFSKKETITREQILGNSKLDFLVGDTYLEIKMPLQNLQVNIPDYVNIRKVSMSSPAERFARHITELANSLKNRQRAILMVCFVYDNPGFRVIKRRSANYEKAKAVVDNATQAGVETWQVNFCICKYDVKLVRYFKIVV
ncbi:MAG: DNA/RNA nuclease SfsA [Candidatus Improbicoccus pseudotrichonymphae]|uniref:DNA/RNA nuclease SfsA n=1 Tax=Candidatus Improbicoccus pseudotrichonymphae TaxID=3033792 RepID=A0AA48I397_9FIRM|nr:MAG: DNA/RNA nuclease SfsA [Candidatus Improbicoccus pseudotrichonymphae]